MPPLPEFLGFGHVMLLAGALMLYVASRAGAHTLAGNSVNPGRRALGHWIPIAATAMVAVAFHRADLAVSIIFAASIGCLSLVLGSMCLMRPDADAPAPFQRLWPLAMPAALLTFLIGFTGHFSWVHATILLFEGVAILFAWQELSSSDEIPAIAGEEIVPEIDKHSFPHRWRLDLTLVVILSFIGAVGAIIGVQRMSRNMQLVSDMATFIAILGPLLVLPILIAGAGLARKNRAWEVTTSAVGVVLLNLCLLLPIVILLWYVVGAIQLNSSNWRLLSLDSIAGAAPMPFGWVTWRVDNVVLLVLAFVLFPPALRRWRLGRAEGIILIALYGVYVLMEAGASMRS
jgi:Ca2+/Na+ antiporter